MSLRKPERTEYPTRFASYIELVPQGDLTDVLNEQTERALQRFGAISEADGSYRYAPDKWSVKQLLGHVADTERIMTYRMLCAARGDASPLPGFDEKQYADAAGFERLTLAELLEGFALVRRATLSLIASLPDEAWERSGVVGGHAITARALAYVTAGHERHHGIVLRERYAAVLAGTP